MNDATRVPGLTILNHLVPTASSRVIQVQAALRLREPAAAPGTPSAHAAAATRVNDSSEAKTYARGRSLDKQDVARWRRAIADVCPIDGATVLDVGSGTGIFMRAWSQWRAPLTVGCEPWAAMRAEARRIGTHDNTVLVAGRAEQLPLASSVADIVRSACTSSAYAPVEVGRRAGPLGELAQELQCPVKLVFNPLPSGTGAERPPRPADYV